MINNKDRAYTNVERAGGVSIWLPISDWVRFQTNVTGRWELMKSGSPLHGIAMASKNFPVFLLPSKSKDRCSHWKTRIQNHVGKKTLGNIFSRVKRRLSRSYWIDKKQPSRILQLWKFDICATFLLTTFNSSTTNRTTSCF